MPTPEPLPEASIGTTWLHRHLAIYVERLVNRLRYVGEAVPERP